MVTGLLASAHDAPRGICVADPNDARLAEFHSKFPDTEVVSTTNSNLEAVARADVVVLAAKPQNAQQIMRELRGSIPEHALVVSIMAGVDTVGGHSILPYMVACLRDDGAAYSRTSYVQHVASGATPMYVDVCV